MARAKATVAPIRVLIADDHAVVREGIRHVLSSDAGFEVVGEAAHGSDAVALAQVLRPDVVVLDISMPELSGLEAASRIRATVPETSVLILSIHEHQEYVVRSIRAGAQGYLRKDSSPAALRDAVRAVHRGEQCFTQAVSLRSQSRIAALTRREREVLTAIVQGKTNKQIAATLDISSRTVESHRESLMSKLGVRHVAALTRIALDAGLAER